MTDFSAAIETDFVLERVEGRSQDRAHLWIDEDGKVSVGARTYYGGDGTPMDEWHNRTLTFTIASGGQVVSAAALGEALAEGGEIAVLVERIIAGHSVEWNGNNNVGTLDDDAQGASDDLERLFEDEDRWTTGETSGSASDCVRGSNTAKGLLYACGLSTTSTKKEVQSAAAACMQDVRVHCRVSLDEDDVVSVLEEAIADVKTKEEEVG